MMPDREKVIKGLQNLRDAIATDYIHEADQAVGTIDDAIELLKGHDGSFIVIDTKTGKEADTYNIALHEEWAKHLCYCDMDGWAIQDDGSLLLLDECGRYAYADRERFKVEWNA